MEHLVEEVFRYFKEVCQIPHGSGNIKKISNYCAAFAVQNGLSYQQDAYGNIMIQKPASPGREGHPCVILQGHLDMVCVKEPGCKKDMEQEGLEIAAEGDWIYAKQTSLGADDGIAVAYALAVLASKTIVHPPLEVILTVDEEIGMLGASALDLRNVSGRLMLNIDSEEEGVFLAGCAGGATVICSFPVIMTSAEGIPVKISLDGLAGGHSGTEIVCQRANANTLAGRMLLYLTERVRFTLVSASGGEKDNAIAKMASVTLLVAAQEVETLCSAIEAFEKIVRHEYEATDAQMTITAAVGESEQSLNVYNEDSMKKIISALVHLPAGVLKMSNEISGLVQTSLNLGILREAFMAHSCKVELCYSVRSAIGSEKDFLIHRLKHFTELLGGECRVSGEYPAWEYRKDSPLRDKITAIYQELFGKPAVVETIHAGVECGIIADKLQGLDCVSFGPDIQDIHTTREKLSISSTERTWKLLLAVLETI